MKRKIPDFTYDKITLSQLSSEDLPETLLWRNHSKNWFNYSDEIDFNQHLDWFEQYQKKDNDFVFIVRDAIGNKIGQSAIYNVDWEKKEGEFGRFLVNPEFAGRGFMKATCKGMLELCRHIFGLALIYLEVKPSNDKAIHIYKSTGFLVTKHLESQNLLMAYQV